MEIVLVGVVLFLFFILLLRPWKPSPERRLDEYDAPIPPWEEQAQREEDAYYEEMAKMDNDPWATSDWGKYMSDEMKAERDRQRNEVVRENPQEWLEFAQELLDRDRDPFYVGILQFSFRDLPFNIHNEDEFNDFCKIAEESLKDTELSIKQATKHQVLYVAKDIPQLFWDTLHLNYDVMCEEFEKPWSTEFIVLSWRTPSLGSQQELDEYLEKNGHPYRTLSKCTDEEGCSTIQDAVAI